MVEKGVSPALKAGIVAGLPALGRSEYYGEAEAPSKLLCHAQLHCLYCARELIIYIYIYLYMICVWHVWQVCAQVCGMVLVYVANMFFPDAGIRASVRSKAWFRWFPASLCLYSTPVFWNPLQLHKKGIFVSALHLDGVLCALAELPVGQQLSTPLNTTTEHVKHLE